MANDITILSCPQCGFPRIRDCGNGLYQCDDCGTHFDKYENIVLTNEDWVRTCTTEQLAEFLNAIIRVAPYDELEPKSFWEHLHPYDGGKKGIVEWLKQPHTIKE